MSKRFKKIWNVITTLIVIAVLILAMLLAGVRIFGLQVYAVLSGSMEPEYHTGSLIYVKKADPYTLKEGDVITFMLSGDKLATHRITAVVPDEDDPSVIRFRTKGDANDAEDGALVHYRNVVGTPVFTIPWLGYAAEYIQHPPGLYVTIAVGAFLMLLMFMPELVSALKGDERGKKPEKKRASAEEKERSKEERTVKEKPLTEGPGGTACGVFAGHENGGARKPARSAGGGAHIRGRHEE